MLPEDLPLCPFCTRLGISTHMPRAPYEPGGANMSSGFSQQTFYCGQHNCHCMVELVSHRGGSLLTFLSLDVCELVDDRRRYPASYTTWVNKTLLPTWRDRAAKLEAHEKTEFRQWLAEVFYVQFPELKGQKSEGEAHSDFTDESIGYHDCPPAAQALYSEQFYGGKNPSTSIFNRGAYLPYPEELAEAVYPPQIPDFPFVPPESRPMGYSRDIVGVFCFYRDDKTKAEGGGHTGWSWVKPEDSQKLVAPEDPILVNSRAFFDDVFAAVETAIEQPLPPRTQIPNGYMSTGIEPWYTFQFGEATIVIGPRKRVISITATLESGFDTDNIRTLATTDNVTYSAEGPMVFRTAGETEAELHAEGKREGVSEKIIAMVVENIRENHPDGQTTRDRRSWHKTAMRVNVHAWDRDKTIEYLTTLCRTVLLAQDQS